MRAVAYSPGARIAAAVLMAISRGSLLVLVALLLFFDTRLANPLRLMRAFTALCLVPGIAAWLMERASVVTLLLERGMLVLQHRSWRIEIPGDAIAGVEPWAIPLPFGGSWLRLASGRRFRYGLHVADPVALTEALPSTGAAAAVRGVARHPAAIYARERNRAARRWYHPILKFVVFGLVPTLPLFRLHQWVAYGGTFGEYYTYGLQAYLLAFALYWAMYTIYLVLYAAVLRAVAEAIAFAAAWIVPARAAGVRRAVEVADRILYFGGVPVLLVRLFLS